MKATSIFLPALVLMLWTLLVLVQVPIRRFSAYFLGRRVVADDFKYGESANVPADVSLPNRIFMNLVEVPVLFYALVLIAFVTNEVNQVTVGLAWLYVALRFAHSLIYFTYNRVVHRFAAFTASNLVVLAMIIYLGIALL
ncbi:MAG: MAPEG family protein [Proteobacteria bacterium]|nr:MAPEG family protein [Pseudomonadota bacterium]